MFTTGRVPTITVVAVLKTAIGLCVFSCQNYRIHITAVYSDTNINTVSSLSPLIAVFSFLCFLLLCSGFKFFIFVFVFLKPSLLKFSYHLVGQKKKLNLSFNTHLCHWTFSRPVYMDQNDIALRYVIVQQQFWSFWVYQLYI